MHVTEANTSAERMAVCARCDVSHEFAISPDGFVVIQQRPGVLQQELNERSFNATFLLFQQRFAADEAAGFVELDREAEPGLERRVLVGDVVAPVPVGLLDAQ